MKTKHVRMYKSTRRNLILMLLTIAALLSGLLFYCVVSEAADVDGGELYLMPEAGFCELIEEIEPEEPQYEHFLPWTFEVPIQPVYEVTDEEADLLVKLGTLEGGCDDVDGIAGVIQVVMNRVESDAFPNTVEEVIFQTNPVQFCTASMLDTATVPPEAYEALDAVVFGEYIYNDCHFFESCEGRIFSGWADYVFTEGGHDFYRVIKEE